MVNRSTGLKTRSWLMWANAIPAVTARSLLAHSRSTVSGAPLGFEGSFSCVSRILPGLAYSGHAPDPSVDGPASRGSLLCLHGEEEKAGRWGCCNPLH